MTTAFDPITLGGTALANRIAMSPMTRSRAVGTVPNEMMATYYAQRASAGLIITEGTQPSAIGQGYPSTPGLHTPEQVAGWQRVTREVHDAGGVIYVQLMHTGRIGHPVLLADSATPVGPSAVRAAGQGFTPEGLKDYVTPHELTADEIDATVEDFAAAARRAVEAGFDGVEVHGANGYLLHQFLSTNANQRQDQWGGSVENRIRFTVAVTSAVADAIGAHRTGLRISPANPYNDVVEEGHRETYTALVDALAPLGLAYLHLLETKDPELTPLLRARWGGVFLLNPATPGAFTSATQLSLVEDGSADLLSFGANFLANPDLPARLAAGGPFNLPDMSRAYGGDSRGYTDYPALETVPDHDQADTRGGGPVGAPTPARA